MSGGSGTPRDDASPTPAIDATAVILAGGRGTRLGRRKEHVPFPGATGATFLSAHLDRWSALFPRVAVSSRTPLDAELPAPIATILDPPEAESVIDGIAAILDALPQLAGGDRPVWIVAVDCPLVPPTLARTALDAHTPGHSVFIEGDRGLEMLCGLYDPSARAAIETLRATGERKLSRIAEVAPARILRFPDDFPPFPDDEIGRLASALGPFFNVNTPEDLARLEAVVAAKESTSDDDEGAP